MADISHKASLTKLNRQKKDLGLEFLYETCDSVYFCLENNGMTYYLIEDFASGKITVCDDENNLYPGYRMVNLLKLKI